jgi:VanZ family protein
MKIRYPYLFAALAWGMLIVYLSSRPGPSLPPLPHPVDWIVHCGAFFGFGYLLCLAIGSPRYFWIAALLTSLYGASDEIHQHFTPGRSSTVGDWLADTTGGVAASVAWYLAWRQGRNSKDG